MTSNPDLETFMKARTRPFAVLGAFGAALALSLVLVPPRAEAETLRLARLFADHMVLQRDQPVRVWGWAEPGTAVAVGVGETTVGTAAGPDGRWETLLPPFHAGGPWTLTVKADVILTVNDVLFGDVWVASGQSNMEWKLGSGVVDGERELAAADDPEIRFFDVPNVVSPAVRADLDGGEWRICSPETAPDMSAVAYFFARDLRRDEGVPIGIVDATWGGTPAEAWTSAGMLLALPHYRARMAEILESDRDWEREFAKNEARGGAKWEQIRDLDKATSYGAQLPDYDDSSWKTVHLPNEEPLSDFVWLRRTVTLERVEKGDYTLRLGTFENVSGVFLNGTRVYAREGGVRTREVGVPEGLLQAGPNLIAIRALNDWNNQVRIAPPLDLRSASGNLAANLDGEWLYSNTVEPPMPEYVRYSHTPSFLYNGMVAPIAGYTLTGAIWYQGESNADEAYAYRILFPAMIVDWRVGWREGSFPFLFVQLANWRQRKSQPTASDWAELREAQLMTLALPDTGMAVIIDIGEADDIHPRNKQDVGHRLALAARHVAYGEDLVYSGPIYRSMEVEGHEVRLSFDHVGSGLAARDGGELEGFAVAGEDRQFAWADARIEGNQVVVSSDLVPSPAAVRYAWADNPVCNLINEEGLPASPFRTDTWPGVTE
jgi:sialate O-acetylesterase